MVTDFRNNECLLEGSRALFPLEMLWIFFFLKFPFWSFLVILKYLTDFRKTVETSMDSRLKSYSLGVPNELYLPFITRTKIMTSFRNEINELYLSLRATSYLNSGESLKNKLYGRKLSTFDILMHFTITPNDNRHNNS